MLSRLVVKNVALIDSAEIQFSEGLNVLSGETGAGKSVILDSVNFVLGAKADRSMIRYGESECFVKAEFSVNEEAAAVRVLRDMDVDSDGEIIISRKFTENGKNSIKINGNTVTAAMLRKVTDTLVDVHGQSEHFYLLSETNQLKLLDGVAGESVIKIKNELSDLIAQKRETEKQIQLLGGDETERNRRIELLNFQIEEIENVALQDGEEEELIAKRNKINNLEKIITAFKEASECFSAENGAMDAIRMARRSISSVAKLDEGYSSIYDRLENLMEEANDISETISDAFDDLYFDENEAEATERRLDEIRSLKRKYGESKEKIDEYLTKIKEEYELLSDCEGQYAFLTAKKDKILKSVYRRCKELSEARRKVGLDFCKGVTEELKTLNIQNAAFEISFNEYGEEDAERASVNGLDDICFMFSANAGEPLKPLGKIISGGEMSRFMLAIKTRLSDVNGISTYIFDEIDAGISGKTAKVVGEKFAKIASRTQIIAVSHLAQIAAMSDAEFYIEKIEESGKTVTRVRKLSETEKTQEIVRLLGGESSGSFAEKHAEELVRQAKEYKNSII